VPKLPVKALKWVQKLLKNGGLEKLTARVFHAEAQRSAETQRIMVHLYHTFSCKVLKSQTSSSADLSASV